MLILIIALFILGNALTLYTSDRFLKLPTNILLGLFVIFNLISRKQIK